MPPALLRLTAAVATEVVQVQIPAGARSMDQINEEIHQNLDRGWLDGPVPALEGATPRQAASDPRLRPALLSLLKDRVRSADEQWRDEGVYEDVYWMLEELGATEILLDPPATLRDR